MFFELAVVSRKLLFVLPWYHGGFKSKHLYDRGPPWATGPMPCVHCDFWVEEPQWSRWPGGRWVTSCRPNCLAARSRRALAALERLVLRLLDAHPCDPADDQAIRSELLALRSLGRLIQVQHLRELGVPDPESVVPGA